MAKTICSSLSTHLRHPQPESHHIVLDGDTLTFNGIPLTSIATGSLQNKIFPWKKEIWKSVVTAFSDWYKKNSLPSIPLRQLEQLWETSWPQHKQLISNHITHRDIVQFCKIFLVPSSTTRTSGLRHYVSTAPVFIFNA